MLILVSTLGCQHAGRSTPPQRTAMYPTVKVRPPTIDRSRCRDAGMQSFAWTLGGQRTDAIRAVIPLDAT
ncbi:MAG: hypothetical protein R6V84_05780 [Desulfobacterales bacterium]